MSKTVLRFDGMDIPANAEIERVITTRVTTNPDTAQQNLEFERETFLIDLTGIPEGLAPAVLGAFAKGNRGVLRYPGVSVEAVVLDVQQSVAYPDLKTLIEVKLERLYS